MSVNDVPVTQGPTRSTVSLNQSLLPPNLSQANRTFGLGDGSTSNLGTMDYHNCEF